MGTVILYLRRVSPALCAVAVLMMGLNAFAANGSNFVNFESPHVHPLDLSPDGTTLAMANTPDGHVWFFDVTTATAVRVGTVAVGFDPVSVRWRTDNEVWVVNHISDTVSVVDVAQGIVVATIDTRDTTNLIFAANATPGDFGDEPTDVVFAGTPEMAYISCSQSNVVIVVDPTDPDGNAVDYIAIEGEEPKSMAVSVDGSKVYVGIFESGNSTTILGGGATESENVIDFPPNVVDDGNTPYGGTNPPPNDGGSFSPPINGSLPAPPEVGLIVRKVGAQWLDDNGMDWTAFVDGANAAQSGRQPGWTLIDNDIAIIDTDTHAVEYAETLMNIVMAVAVNPFSGAVTAVGTEALNEVRFEPVVNGVFLRVRVASADGTTGATEFIEDLNDHLEAIAYATPTIPQNQRNKSIGDPRAIVWSQTGDVGYVAGMGSNNVVVIDENGDRIGLTPTIEVGEGPTGLALDESRNRLYVVNKFEGSLSVINTQTETVIDTVPYFDPTPEPIKVGRKHLYDTHKTSGLGHVACASCHVDGRMDRLAWDLGDPIGEVIDLDPMKHNLGAGVPGLAAGNTLPFFQDFHPMKGPMTTQTLQDIIGKEPFHWRGDRQGLEEFNPAFQGLQGDDVQLTPQEMQEFEDMLATMHFPPNPFRNLDNTLKTSMDLPGHYAPGRFGPNEGAPLPPGNAVAGLNIYRGGPSSDRALDSGAFTCVTCHTLPIGNGGDTVFNGNFGSPAFSPFPIGPMGQNHVQLVSVDGSSNKAIKTPQLRNGYEKIGLNMSPGNPSRSGFGILHDGSVDGLARFVSEETFMIANDQEIANLVALLLSFSGGFDDDMLLAMGTDGLRPHEFPRQLSKDAHAATGKQIKVDSGNLSAINDLIALAEAGKIDLVIKGEYLGAVRGFVWIGGTSFQSDRDSEIVDLGDLAAKAPGDLTITSVPAGSGTRVGIDRDEDGYLDFDEVLSGSDPASEGSIPQAPAGPMPVSGWPALALVAALLLLAGVVERARRRA